MSKMFKVVPWFCWVLVCHCSGAGSSVRPADASDSAADAATATGGTAVTSGGAMATTGGTAAQAFPITVDQMDTEVRMATLARTA